MLFKIEDMFANSLRRQRVPRARWLQQTSFPVIIPSVGVSVLTRLVRSVGWGPAEGRKRDKGRLAPLFCQEGGGVVPTEHLTTRTGSIGAAQRMGKPWRIGIGSLPGRCPESARFGKPPWSKRKARCAAREMDRPVHQGFVRGGGGGQGRLRRYVP